MSRNIFEYANDARRRANRAQSSAPLHSAVLNGSRGAFAAQMAAQRAIVDSFPRVA